MRYENDRIQNNAVPRTMGCTLGKSIMTLKTSWAIVAVALLSVLQTLAVNPPWVVVSNTPPADVPETSKWIRIEGSNLTCVGQAYTYTCTTAEGYPGCNILWAQFVWANGGTRVSGGGLFDPTNRILWDVAGTNYVMVTHNSNATNSYGTPIPQFNGQVATALVTVVKVDSISTNSTSDTTWPINVLSNSSLTFYAKPYPGAPWPDGKPVWGGMASGSGTDTVNVTFSTPGATNVTAECGNVVTAAVNVLYLAIDKTNADHICTFGPHGDTHVFNISIVPDPSPVPVTLELPTGSPSASFVTIGPPSPSLDVSTSQTLTVTGLVAGADAVLRGRFNLDGMPWITNTFDVVNVNTFTLYNRNCTDSLATVSMADSNQETTTPPSQPVEVMLKTNTTTAKIGLKLSWTPTNHLDNFKWRVGPTTECFTAQDTETTGTVSVTPGVLTDVTAWFDCHSNNIVNAEPERNLQLLPVAFHGVKLRNVTTSVDDTCALGIGQTGIASNSVIMPADRDMVWSYTVATNCDASRAVLVTATQVGNAYRIEVSPDSGTGSITLEVHDSKHPSCVVEKLEVKIGCPCTSCAPGGMLTGVCSVHAQIDLGRTKGGGSAGQLDLSADDISTNSYRPVGLLPPHRRYEDGILVASSGADDDQRSVVEDGMMKQHRSPEVLVDVHILDEFGYEIRCYPNSEVGNFNTSLNRFEIKHADATIARYVVENPDRSLTNTTRLKITEFRGGKSNVTLYAKSGTVDDRTWTMSTGNGLRQESVRDYTLAGTPIRVTEISDATSNLLRRTTQEFYNFEWGRSVVRERVAVETGDFDGPSQLITTWTYHTTNGMPGYGQVAKQVNPDGSWTAFEYDAQNRQTKVTRGFKDGTGSPDVSQTVYAYTLHPDEIADYMWGTPRTVIETTQGITNGISYQAYMMSSNAGERVEISERAASPTNAFGSAGNLRTETVCYHDDYSDSNLVGRVKYVKQADGLLTSYSYEIGSYQFGTSGVFTAAGTGDFLRTTSIQGTGSNPSGIVNRTIASVSITDKLGRQVFTQSSVFDGSDYVPVDWTATFSDEAGHVTNSLSANGNRTDTEWGCCGKDRETDAFGTVTEYLYDDLKRVDMSIKVGTGTNQSVYSLYTYDAEGRQLTQTISAGALSQASTNTYDLAGRVISSVDQSGVTTTYFYDGLTSTTIRGGLTNVTVNYLDGTGKYSSENGVIKSWTDVGINADGTRWTTTFTGPDGTNSPMWQKTTTDFLGRTVKTERPGFGGAIVTAEEVYNNLGQLVRSVVSSPSSMAMTLFEYNELGEQFRNCVDINTNGSVNLNGPDRVSESASWFQQEGGDYWQVRASIIYAGDGSASPTTNSIQKTRLTGFSEIQNLRSEMVGTDLLGNSTTSRSYVARATKTVTQTVTYPDSTNSAVQTTVNGQLTTSLSKTGVRTEYAYDALGRQIEVRSTSGAGVTPSRNIATVTHYNAKGQVDSTMDAASNTTVFVYDDQGRRTAVTDALSNSTYTAYDAEGHVLATWGGTYPVAYDYDDFGRMTAMYTYRGTNSLSSYSEIANLKSQMDRTTWLYELATGLLTNKVYADGQGPAYTYTADGKLASRNWARGIVTTYSYDGAGQLTNIDYSDNTPDVSFTFDRLGRQTTITDGQGTRAFTYNDTLQLATETNAMGTITRNYDSLGRPAGFSLDEPYSVRYGFDSMGRFSSVTATNNQSPITNILFCSYSYLTGSDILSGWEITCGETTSVSSTRTYEPNRNLIVQVLNLSGTNLISQFDYVNDAIGRRTQRIDSTAVMESSSLTNDFGYNTRSELIEALMGTNSHSYRYDPIGNRQTATNNAEAWSYAANALNQYSQITNNQSPITPTYDADGNMLTYNGWTFGWNGENRLIAASNGATVVTFAYDFMGRRYQKVIGTTTNTFLYDGWNLIAETQVSGVSTQVSFYAWGLDLSGTLQGAGGIGGLLSASLSNPATSNSTTVFYAYDANGNVTDLVGANGESFAQYQFDPYGNTSSKSGVLADVNPFRFSTKYLDAETSLYYYGHRYHSPGLGRWISLDPIGEDGGFNIYGFVGNNPTTLVDPFGLEWSDPERIGGRRARTTCEACDTVSQLAAKIHMGAEEFTEWLSPDAPGTSLPADADTPISETTTFTVPNIVYITYGNMRANYASGGLIGPPTDMSFYNKFLARGSEMEGTFGSKGYRVYNFTGSLGIGGNPIGVHQGVLGNADIAAWGFFGHGASPDGIFIGESAEGYGTAYQSATFRIGQRYRLSEVVLFSCFQGTSALLPGWLDLVAKGGNLVARPMPVNIDWGGWSLFYYNPSHQHIKP